MGGIEQGPIPLYKYGLTEDTKYKTSLSGGLAPMSSWAGRT